MEKSSRKGHVFFEQTVKPKDFEMSDHTKAKLINHFNNPIKQSKLARLHSIYNLLDEVVAAIPNVCRKGCAHCCNIDVDVTPLEIEYIKKNTAITITASDVYCPLLNHDTATCSVYKYRPFNCRAFLVFNSPDYCRDDKPQFSTGGPQNGFANHGIKLLSLEMLTIDFGQIIKPEHKYAVQSRIKDIREFFK